MEADGLWGRGKPYVARHHPNRDTAFSYFAEYVWHEYHTGLDKVAKLVKIHAELGRRRDAFFVSMGAFDTHGDTYDTLAGKMTGRTVIWIGMT